MTTLSRKAFLNATMGGSALLLLNACGGGGSDSMPAAAPAQAATCGASGAAVSGNHGHTLLIAAADLDSAVAKTYSIQGAAGHDHAVTFTPGDLQKLKAGQMVTITSATTLGHDHNVTASCV